MDKNLKYKSGVNDPLSKPDAALKANLDSSAYASNLYLNATQVDIDPFLTGQDDSFQTEASTPPPNVSSAGAAPSDFTEETLDIVDSSNNAATRIFLTKQA